MDERVRLFKALGDENRLRILEALGEGTYCCGDLVRRTGICQPTVSHHIKVLRASGLIKGTKEGQWLYLTIDRDRWLAHGLDPERILHRDVVEAGTEREVVTK